MNNKKLAIWGFLFGTVGLYLLAVLSLAIPFVEYLTSIFRIPGQFLAGILAGEDASGTEAVFLWLFSGLIYANIFVLIGYLFRREK